MFDVSNDSPSVCLHLCLVVERRALATFSHQNLLSPLVLLLVLCLVGLVSCPNAWLLQALVSKSWELRGCLWMWDLER